MIEEAIHEVLAAADLPVGLPPDRIVTGNVQSSTVELPYATVNLESNAPDFYTNNGRTDSPNIRVKLWSEDHTAGCAIRDKLIEILDNQTFSTTKANLISVRKENDFAIQEEDGVWQFVIDFNARMKAA